MKLSKTQQEILTILCLENGVIQMPIRGAGGVYGDSLPRRIFPRTFDALQKQSLIKLNVGATKRTMGACAIYNITPAGLEAYEASRENGDE